MRIHLIAINTALMLTILLCVPVWAQIEISGPQSGVLASDEYIVTDSLFVMAGEELTIEAGAVLRFETSHGFGVAGRLNAIGTEEDSIHFISDPEGPGSWGGLDITATASPLTNISHCIIRHSSTSAIDVDSVDISIAHCLIENNPGEIRGGGISIRGEASPDIGYCRLVNNSGNLDGGNIYVYIGSSPTIHDCWIEEGVTEFGGGLYCTGASPIIERCVFLNNEAEFLGGGIYSYASQPIVSQCTFVGNDAGDAGSGLLSYHYGPLMINCLFYQNLNGGFEVIETAFTGSATHNLFYDNDGGDAVGLIPEGMGELTQVNTWGDSCDQYQNLFMNPHLANPEEDNFALTWESPGIDAGDPSGPWDDDTTQPDIGAYPFPQQLLSGPQQGALTAANYRIDDSLYIPQQQTLTIEAGGVLRFNQCALIVQGELQAQGEEGDSIRFTDTGSLGWEGIDFLSGSSTNSLINHSVITASTSSGVQALQASPTIRDSRLSFNINSGQRGGGIKLLNSASATIERCVITDNSGELDGGGIYCADASNAEISDCIIKNNSSDFGGGVYTNSADITLTNCLLVSNHAGWYGGGLYGYNTDSEIQRCVFVNNHADRKGGGIHNRFAGMTIQHCTLYNNSADTTGGGIQIWDGSDADLRNTLVTGSSPEGIYQETPEDADAAYNLVWNSTSDNFGGDGGGGWGVNSQVNLNGDSCDVQFNLSLDPLLIDPEDGDFHLQAGSPCINAGDPSLPYDPDESVADIGRYFRVYNAPCLQVLDPVVDFGEVVIEDSTATQTLRVSNTGGCMLNIDSTVTALPDSVLWVTPQAVEVNPGDTVSLVVSWQPLTETELTGNSLSLYHNDPNLNNPQTISLEGYSVSTTQEGVPALPLTTRLAPPYPNPFNATVAVPLELAQRQQLRLEVFNILGQRVATLVDQEVVAAGYHRLLWRASGMANGIYFIRMHTPHDVQTQRVMLLQ